MSLRAWLLGKGWLRESHINFTFNYSSEVHLLIRSVSHFCVTSPFLGMVKASLIHFTANAARRQSQPWCRAGSEQMSKSGQRRKLLLRSVL